MSSYGSSPSNLNTNITSVPSSSTSTSTSITTSSNTRITSARSNRTITSVDTDQSGANASNRDRDAIVSANIQPRFTEAQQLVDGYEYAVELQFATKTNFYYDSSDKYAAGSSEDPDGPLLTTAFVPSGDPAWPSYQKDEEYAITTQVIKWTIASNAPIQYGYHLDGSPFVQDNSNVDNGGLVLISVTDEENNTLARTEYNAWYEPVEISNTAINPDNGKLPTAHIGQKSRGAQESDITFRYNDDPELVDEDNTFIPLDSPLRHTVDISIKPWLGIPDYHYSCIPAGRGFIDAGGGDGYTDIDGNEVETQLLGSPFITEANTFKLKPSGAENKNYGQGDYAQAYCYPNYYDGRGQFVSGNFNSEHPRDQVTGVNVELADEKDKAWIQAYGNENGPWMTEGQWLAGQGGEEGSDIPFNDTGYNYLAVKEGIRNNRTSPGSGHLPVTASYDFGVQNSGLIKDRDGVVRWSGQWNPSAKDEDNISPYILKANDLVVTQYSHWDHRGVEQTRKYCRQRYQLYNLAAEHSDLVEENEDFTWYRTGKAFPEFPNNERSGDPATDTLYPLPDDFDQIIAENPTLYPDLVPVPSSAGVDPTFRSYEAAVINRYAGGKQSNNRMDSVKGWGWTISQNQRYPFIDMTACLSVVPPIELSGEFADADFDGSGEVDGFDLTALLTAWGTTPGEPGWNDGKYDLNGDGIVDGTDLTILLDAWINQGGSVVDYSKTFRPPLNWDPTNRNSVPYMTEIDDIDDYTIDGPGAKPLAAGIDPDTDIPLGQIGYPNTAMDGGTAQAWEIYTADPNEGDAFYREDRFPKGLNMTMSDIYWPELKVQNQSDLIGDGDPDDPETWDYQTATRYCEALKKALPKYLRLGTSIVWHAAGQNDNRVQGAHGGGDLAMSNYGSQEGAEYELLALMSFDKNLDPENLIKANVEQPGLQGFSPSLSWLYRHYGTDWDKQPDPNNPNLRIDKRGGVSESGATVGPQFSLRYIIRRALTQRGIDIYGGMKSCGKYQLHNAGHTDWWDLLCAVGVACTQFPDWIDMLDTGTVGVERNGTIKNFASRVGKDDPDYVYDQMDNRGTFPGGIGAIAPDGQANLTNTPAGYLQGNGIGAYAHNTMRYKDLSVKSVDDYTIMQVPSSENSANLFDGQSLPPQNLPDIFPNQLVTVYPAVGGQCGNQNDSLYYKLKEIVDADKEAFLQDPNNAELQQRVRDLRWRGLYQQGIVNADGTIQHAQGDEVTTWKSTDTKEHPNGLPAPDITDAPVNRLQSGVEPEWIADVDKPYSFLSKVPDENMIRYDDQYFNVMRVKLDENGNRVFETNDNYYKPHKDVWKPIDNDFRAIDRWRPDLGNNGICDDSYSQSYFNQALENATDINSRYAPLTGMYPRGYEPNDSNTAKSWGVLTNQDFMSSNYHRGLYLKNTTLDANGDPTEHYGKISVVVANITEHVRNSECSADSRAETVPTVINQFPMGSNLGLELEGMKETINGKNANSDLGPTARAMRFLLLDDIGLTDDDGNLLPNATVDIAHNLKFDFEDPERLAPGINTWANVGSYSNTHSFGGFKSYEWVWQRGSFTMGMVARMFSGIRDEDKQEGTEKVRSKPVSEIVDSLPAYFAKLYVKYPTFWNNPIGRAITEEDQNTSHSIFAGGNAQGVNWNDGRGDVKTPNWQDRGDNSQKDNFYGGSQFKELIRALFNQELMSRIDGPSGVVSKWRDPENGRKWCSSIKEKLYRWKNDPDVIGEVLPVDTDGTVDFSMSDVIPVADFPENTTAIARSNQGRSVLFQSWSYTMDSPDGQQATMARNSSTTNSTGEWPYDKMEEGQYPIPTTGTPEPPDGWADDIYIPKWTPHKRVFTKQGSNYGSEKTNFSTSAGVGAAFTIIGQNKNSTLSVDLDKVVGRPVANGDVTDPTGELPDTTPENRRIAETDADYDLYLNNDGYRITSGSGGDNDESVIGVLPYKQFVKGKSLYVWLHGLSRWQELVLVSEKVNTQSNTIKSHGPRSGATKGGDGLGTNDFSEDGFQDDPTDWTQVWALPNKTDVLEGEQPSEPKPLGVWANMSDSFARDGLANMAVFYADPTGIK